MQTAAESQAKPAPGVQLASHEFLAFKVGSEEYGIDILGVQEIRSYEEPTRIANACPAVKGIVNLRGVIVPIIDLRLVFNLDQAAYDSSTVVIVLNMGKLVVGIVVDAVSDVTRLSAEQLRPIPEFDAGMRTDHLLAIGAIDQRMLILIEIEKLLASAELGLVDVTVH